jgi:hypothetical protein
LEKRDHPNHSSLPFKEKEKEGEGRSKAWWPMEGKGEGSLLSGQMEGEGEGSLLGGQWKEKEKVLCYIFSLFPQALYLNLHFLSFDIEVLLYHGPKPLFTHYFPFLGL